MISDEINKQNLEADRFTYGKWGARHDQFAAEEPLQTLYDLLLSARPGLPDTLNVIEYGSAEGLVGEYFKKKLTEEAGKIVSLTLVDVVQEHLDANNNTETKKVCADLTEMNFESEYDLGIGRSILHYFSEDAQTVVLKNIYNSLKPKGYFLSQNFIQLDSDLELYLKLNRAIGKSFSLVSVEKLEKMFTEAGFKEIQMLGSLPVWDFSSETLQQRYHLSNQEIERFRKVIEDAPITNRVGFKLTNTGFTVPIPYKIFLMRK